MNIVALRGRLTSDPVLKSTGAGKNYVTVGFAFSQYGATDEDKTGFTDIVVWGKGAELMCRNLAKGRLIYIDASLKYSSWLTKEQQKRSKLGLHVNLWWYGDSKKSEPAPGPSNPGKPMGYNDQSVVADDYSDIPF